MKKHKNYGLSVWQIINFPSHTKPGNSQNSPNNYQLYQLQHKDSTRNFIKSQVQIIAAVVVTRQEQMLLL